MIEYASLRSQILELEVGEQMVARNAKRATLQNYTSVIKEITGRKFRVRKQDTPHTYIVLRYE